MWVIGVFFGIIVGSFFLNVVGVLVMMNIILEFNCFLLWLFLGVLIFVLVGCDFKYES